MKSYFKIMSIPFGIIAYSPNVILCFRNFLECYLMMLGALVEFFFRFQLNKLIIRAKVIEALTIFAYYARWKHNAH